MTFGIDIGTTSVAGIAVDAAGTVLASETRAHEADLPRSADGVDEQDPERLLSAAQAVIAALVERCGQPEQMGWTGQMHGVVAVDRGLSPLTPFVTWRDARRYGGPVMAGWAQDGLTPYKCLTAPGYVMAKLEGKIAIDSTFLESWHIVPGTVPTEWIPEIDEFSMIGDNQAGVFAAQCMFPGSAVVNLGTSGQLSRVVDDSMDGDSPRFDEGKVEKRAFPGGKTLICRASLIGGQALAALRRELGVSWDELNGMAMGDNADCRVVKCVNGIIDDLFVGMDLSGVKSIVGIGNALVRNSCLRAALECRSGLSCAIPQVSEMAAYGAAMRVNGRA